MGTRRQEMRVGGGWGATLVLTVWCHVVIGQVPQSGFRQLSVLPGAPPRESPATHSLWNSLGNSRLEPPAEPIAPGRLMATPTRLTDEATVRTTVSGSIRTQSRLPEPDPAGTIAPDVEPCVPPAPPACCPPPPPPPVWSGGVYGLVIARDNEDPVYFSYSDQNEAIQLLNSRQAGGTMGTGPGTSSYAGGGAGTDWHGGVEARLNRVLCDGYYGVQAVYWGLPSHDSESNLLRSRDITPGFNLRATMDFSGLIYDAGDGFGYQSTELWFDNNVARHRIRRTNAFHNVELNFVSSPRFGPDWIGPVGCRCPLRLGWLVGVRWLMFDEHFQFASDRANEVFGDSPFDEMFFDMDVGNNLIGPQVGGHFGYALTNRFDVFTEVKLGVVANHISQYSRIGGANGPAIVGAGPNAGRPYDVRSSKTDASLLSELSVGLGYRLFGRWRLTGGYRAVGLTSIAIANEQIPPDLRGIDDVVLIDSNASMILHGAYAGLEFVW